MKIELDINDLEGLNDSILEKLEDLSDSDFNALIVEALKQKFVNTSLEDIIYKEIQRYVVPQIEQLSHTINSDITPRIDELYYKLNYSSANNPKKVTWDNSFATNRALDREISDRVEEIANNVRDYRM